MRRLLLAAAAALTLAVSGCAGTVAKIETAYKAATGAVVTPQAVYIAINTFNAVELTATKYVKLPRCPATGACRNPTISADVVAWVGAGLADRDRLQAALDANPGQSLSLADVYQHLQDTTAKLVAAVVPH